MDMTTRMHVRIPIKAVGGLLTPRVELTTNQQIKTLQRHIEVLERQLAHCKESKHDWQHHAEYLELVLLNHNIDWTDSTAAVTN